MQRDNTRPRPIIYRGDLTNLPDALRPLIVRPQWVIWKLTWRHDRWSKVPYRCDDPERFASSADSASWSAYEVAVAAAGAGDGITYVLTPDDPFAAVDIDHVRDPSTGTIEPWAQRLLDRAGKSYCEVSPSGTGLRIWGLADGKPLHHKFSFGDTALELFRRTRKPLTVTGLQLGSSQQLGNIDAMLDWATVWGEKHKKNAANSSAASIGTAACLSLDDIERIVREGPPEGANRSDVFHQIVGHFRGVGWTVEQIVAEFEEYPQGIGSRYIAEQRLTTEVERSFSKYQALRAEPAEVWTGGWKPQAQPQEQTEPVQPEQLEQAQGSPNEAVSPHVPDRLEQLVRPEHPPSHAQPVVEQPDQGKSQPPLDEYEQLELEERQLAQEPELDESELDEELKPKPALPPMYCHGDPDPRPVRRWAIKKMMPACGHGLLSGQWGTYKSFMALELAASLMTSQPFLDRIIERQCGVLFLLAEGAEEMRVRLEVMVHEKCGAMPRAPFRWYETCPVLLARGSLDKLIAMARKADASLRAEFALPLGLIVIDTVAASAGYAQMGAESDNAIGQQLMNLLKLAAVQLDCFVLGIDHFGKNINTGTRGGSSKEGSADLVLACLGERELSGRVANLRLAIRKCRGGPSGLEFSFSMREVTHPQPDEEGNPITTLVVDWTAPTAPPGPGPDPWEGERRTDARQAMLLLKRVLMAKLAEHGEELETAGGPIVRGIDQEVVREEFYQQTPADGTERQKRDVRRKRFVRTINRAIEKGLIGMREIGAVTWLWLLPNLPSEDDDF
jgi:hypothetical protein